MYCRYLDISLSHGYSTGVCGGRFGYYLKDVFAIEKLPYDLKLSKLISAGALSPDLFVRLPKSYFIKWTNFPECPAKWQGDTSEVEKAAGNFNIHNIFLNDLSLNDLLHPYDSEPLNSEFVKRFEANTPKNLKAIKTTKFRGFIPSEAYFAYWRGYVLVDALTGYLDIDWFLSEKRGVAELVRRISSVNEVWNQKYKRLFQRLSLYRTAMSAIKAGHAECPLTYQQISDFLLGFSGSAAESLEDDLEQLLILFNGWQNEVSRNGRTHLVKALELLKQDIYHLFEWLCIATEQGEDYYFNKWSPEDRQPRRWARLNSVITYEEFDLRKTFLGFAQFYCEEINVFGYADNLENTYKNLCTIDSFPPWIRSFSDLHKNINLKGILDFKQPRIIDFLIVITIRTEIVIRDMYIHCLEKKDSPDDLFDVLKGIAEGLNNKKKVKVLESLRGDKAKTRLNDKPECLFSNIDSIQGKTGWNKEMMYFYEQILKFVTSRNYFAHHSYQDESINSKQSNIAADVLKSCIQTLVFLDSVLQESRNLG
jgi:hypothetical protein